MVIGLIPVMMLMGAMVMAVEAAPDTITMQAAETLSEAAVVSLPQGVYAALPEGEVQRLTITRQRLAQGRMLTVDEAHPLPDDTDAPNTFGVLSYAHGRIACRDQQAQLGKETLCALEDLCVDARNRGIGCLTVFAGTRSPEQQRILLNERVADLTRDMPIEQAVVKAKQHVPPPGCSEHQLPWTVDIRICRGWNRLPEAERLDASEEGRWLVANAWVYGFVQRWPDADPAEDDHRPYCFRYVGLVHAKLMHVLDVGFDDYLQLLITCGALTLTDENGAPVLSAVYAEAGERHTVFEVPSGVEIDDASLDNLGGAVLAFTY